MKRISIIFFGTLWFFAGVPVWASETVSLSPTLEKIQLVDGKNATFETKIKNSTTQSLRFRLSATDFGNLDFSGGVAFLGSGEEQKTKYGLAAWMKPHEEWIAIEAGQEKIVSVSIENDETLAPGGHYGALVFTPEENIGQQTETISLNQKMAVLVFVQKTGGERFGLELRSFSLPSLAFVLPEMFRIRFSNTGNVHTVPRGEVLTLDSWGKTVTKGVINEESGIILPETERDYLVKMMSLEKFYWPGRYEVVIKYRYEGQESFEEQRKLFWFLPVNSIGFLLVAGGVFWWIRKKWLKNKQKNG